MISFSAYLYDKDTENYGITEEFMIHSCGNYRFVKRKEFYTKRPNGRQDYQMIYIFAGKAHFFFEGTEYILDEGNLILFKPFEAQEYKYFQEEHPDIYWIHFAGTKVAEILEDFHLTERVMKVGIQKEYKNVFEKIIRELMMKRQNYLEMNSILAKELFLDFSRNMHETEEEKRNRNEKIEQIIEWINKAYHEEIAIEDLAEEYGFSTCWFIKIFKEYTGYTPGQYITGIRLEKARELLHSNAYNISEIAALCGYENPLYFSRIFKKHYGISPKYYRKD